MSEAPTVPISRRRFLGTTAAARRREPLATGGLRPGPARAQGSLKGTKLTIIAGDWYVPETNKMLDDLVAALARTPGWTCKVERFAGEQQVAKVAAIVGSGAGRRHRGRPGLRRLPLRRQADRRDRPGERDRQDVRRLVRRRPAGLHGEGPLEGAHDRPGAGRLELPDRHVPRRRRREVPRHLRRAAGRGPEAPREGHARSG